MKFFLNTENCCVSNKENLLTYLKKDGIVGVANGRAEFGPRALGNRSLLAEDSDMFQELYRVKVF